MKSTDHKISNISECPHIRSLKLFTVWSESSMIAKATLLALYVSRIICIPFESYPYFWSFKVISHIFGDKKVFCPFKTITKDIITMKLCCNCFYYAKMQSPHLVFGVFDKVVFKQSAQLQRLARNLQYLS